MKQATIKKLNDKAIIPTKGSVKAAGYDLCSTEFYTLKPGERHLFKTGLSMEIPTGLYGRIAPRSGLAYKNGIDVLAGVIDEDYRGEIGVILINLGQQDKDVLVGDKIAQIIFENYTDVDFQLASDLNATDRGSGGYGSTDRKQPNMSFTLYKKVNLERDLPLPIQAEVKFRFMRHDGEIYSCTENGKQGVCVVDSSGQVLDKYFWA